MPEDDLLDAGRAGRRRPSARRRSRSPAAARRPAARRAAATPRFSSSSTSPSRASHRAPSRATSASSSASSAPSLREALARARRGPRRPSRRCRLPRRRAGSRRAPRRRCRARTAGCARRAVRRSRLGRGERARRARSRGGSCRSRPRRAIVDQLGHPLAGRAAVRSAAAARGRPRGRRSGTLAACARPRATRARQTRSGSGKPLASTWPSRSSWCAPAGARGPLADQHLAGRRRLLQTGGGVHGLAGDRQVAARARRRGPRPSRSRPGRTGRRRSPRPARPGRAPPRSPGRGRRRGHAGTPKTAITASPMYFSTVPAVLLQSRSARPRRRARGGRAAPPGRGSVASLGRADQIGEDHRRELSLARRQAPREARRTRGRTARHHPPKHRNEHRSEPCADDTLGLGATVAPCIPVERRAMGPRLELPCLCVSPCWASRPLVAGRRGRLQRLSDRGRRDVAARSTAATASSRSCASASTTRTSTRLKGSELPPCRRNVSQQQLQLRMVGADYLPG